MSFTGYQKQCLAALVYLCLLYSRPLERLFRDLMFSILFTGVIWMNSMGMKIRGESGTKRIELVCEHQNGLLYVVPSDASWVCSGEFLHVHALAGFLRELVNLDEPKVKQAMQRWGLYYRERSLEGPDESD